MKIGVPKEIKKNEHRVGLVPAAVRELVGLGHEVLVETKAGSGIGADDAEYKAAGAQVLTNVGSLFERAELIVKVKEPQPSEYGLFDSSHTLFTYLHLAADRPLTQALLDSGTTAIAYETITDTHGGLPLLRPMSEIAGRLSVQAGAYSLQAQSGGAGVLLGGAAGVSAAEVVIIGGGVVGTNAAKMALGLGARVTILDKSVQRLAELDDLFGGRVNSVYANRSAIAQWSTRADLLIGAVLIPGAAAPKLIDRSMLQAMQTGSVLVDVAIDQGGCFETSRATTHAEPTYVVDGIVHYCVANMPGAVPKTSAFALNNVTLPYIVRLAEQGVEKALKSDLGFSEGLNISDGRVMNQAVAQALDLPAKPLMQQGLALSA